MESETVLTYKKNGTLINIYKVPKEITVYSGDREFIKTSEALLLKEKGHKPVYYYPLKDARVELLSPSDNRTFCPFKGEANYYDLLLGERTLANSV